MHSVNKNDWVCEICQTKQFKSIVWGVTFSHADGVLLGRPFSLQNSIDSEERKALEVFEQIYKQHDERAHHGTGHHQGAGHSSHHRKQRAYHRKHQYENTVFSVLGPGFQEGTTSFLRSDAGDQSEAPNTRGREREPLRFADGTFYFSGQNEKFDKGTQSPPTLASDDAESDDGDGYEDGPSTPGGTGGIASANRSEDAFSPSRSLDAASCGHTLDTSLSGEESEVESYEGVDDGISPPGGITDNAAEHGAGHVIDENQSVKNRITVITGNSERGSVTSYTIHNNVVSAADSQLFHSTVIIASESAEAPPPLPPFSTQPPLGTSDPGLEQTSGHLQRNWSSASISSSLVPPGSEKNDTDQWNTLYSNNASHASNIDDVTEASSEHGAFSDAEEAKMPGDSFQNEARAANRSSAPEYARVYKVNMNIHRLPGEEDFSKAPSWLHNEFVNAAYVSD